MDSVCCAGAGVIKDKKKEVSHRQSRQCRWKKKENQMNKWY